MVDDHPPVTIGRMVRFYDEDKQEHVGIVAFVQDQMSRRVDRPICNLAIFKVDGRVANRKNIEPAYHNGEVWVVINKWAWPDEVPND